MVESWDGHVAVAVDAMKGAMMKRLAAGTLIVMGMVAPVSGPAYAQEPRLGGETTMGTSRAAIASDVCIAAPGSSSPDGGGLVHEVGHWLGVVAPRSTPSGSSGDSSCWIRIGTLASGQQVQVTA
jgi:hypothetical protein